MGEGKQAGPVCLQGRIVVLARFCLIGPLQNTFSLAEEGRTRSGESNITLIAQEKLGADFLLQVQNGLADGWLSDVEATRSLAVVKVSSSWINDLRGRGIRVNVLSPGHIDTPGLSVLMSDEQKASVVANVSLGRMGTPGDVGKVAVFLASDDSSYVNCVELFADGGVAQY
jgi:hypothetical protein